MEALTLFGLFTILAVLVLVYFFSPDDEEDNIDKWNSYDTYNYKKRKEYEDDNYTSHNR